jgi:microcompartment protein CcmL/EutN
MDPAVLAMLICVRGFVSAVALAILLGVHHICQVLQLISTGVPLTCAQGLQQSLLLELNSYCSSG